MSSLFAKEKLWTEINDELKRQKKEMPNFPDHGVAQVAIVCNYSGMALNDSIIDKYGDLPSGAKRLHLIQTICAALRAIENDNNT